MDMLIKKKDTQNNQDKWKEFTGYYLWPRNNSYN